MKKLNYLWNRKRPTSVGLNCNNQAKETEVFTTPIYVNEKEIVKILEAPESDNENVMDWLKENKMKMFEITIQGIGSFVVVDTNIDNLYNKLYN